MLNLDPKEPLIQDELPESERLVDKINRVAGGQAMLSLLLAMIGVFLGLGVDRIFYFVAGGGVLVFIPAAIVARSSMVGYKRVAILATGLKVLGSVSPILVAAAIFMFVSSPVKGATDALLKALFGFVFVYSVWAMRNDFLLSSRIQKALAKDAAEKAQ